MASMARALLSAASVVAIAGSVLVPTGAIAEAAASAQDVAPNPVWPRPAISPIPQATNGVANPVQNLDGTWKLAVDPPSNFWSNDVDPAGWADVSVPGQPTMQGFAIRQNVEFAYKTKVHVSADFAGKRIVEQFDGVYSYARLWVNGQLVRDHTGGMTTWDADITAFVTPGADAWITVGVTDKSDDISDASGYAQNLVGGILRDVRLLALPAQPLTRFDADTQLDSAYTNAVMRVYVGAAVQDGTTVTVGLRLLDPKGVAVATDPSTVDVTSAHPEAYVDVPVASPRLWDPEHPWLYSLQATEYVGGQPAESVIRQIGFRQIDVRGNKVLVNGHEVKLRGADHHQISPTGGRSTTPDLDANDIRLFRAANVNIIRTSHYPPTPTLLAAADKYGMLVDEETAVTWSSANTQSDPNFKTAYLNQFAEMIARDRVHPSVLMWSLGNESPWGTNFAAEYAYAKAEDPSRPAIFSCGCGAGDPVQTDIVSVHYPAFDGPFGGQSKPVLYDEYAPLPAVTIDQGEQRRDPNVENWWGVSMKALWQKVFTADGALGGGIWAGIDDTFLLRNGPAGYGEWGLLDVWRRERPEYWLTKKAYSPVHVDDTPLQWPTDKTVRVPVANWFDFTNLDELRVAWTAGSQSGTLAGPDVMPHANGTISIPISHLSPRETVDVKFYRRADPAAGSADLLVDEYRLPFRTGAVSVSVDPTVSDTARAPTLGEDASHITVTGSDFQVDFSKQTGLVDNATIGGKTLIESGPYLNLVGAGGANPLSPWTLDSISAQPSGNAVAIDIRGHYGSVGVTFTITIDGDALLKTSYAIDHPPGGAYAEVGVTYMVPDAVDRLTWSRQALWSVYPSDHIGRPTGTALKDRSGAADQYGTAPNWAWSQDEKQYALFGKNDPGGRGTTDFRAGKQNIYDASAVLGGTDLRLRAESNGSDSVRLETAQSRLGNAVNGPCSLQRCVDDANSSIVYSGTWYPQSNPYSQPGYQSTWTIGQTAGDSATFDFTGTSIKWIGDTQFNMGMADVYVDGQLAAHDVDLYSPLNDPTGSPPQGGHYQQVLFSKDGLAAGQHTVKVVVTGDHNPLAGGTWVNIDAFAVDGPPSTGILPGTGIAFMDDNFLTYPQLGYGDYQLPGLTIPDGYTNSVSERLTNRGGVPAALVGAAR
jgi:hypothetical protein